MLERVDTAGSKPFMAAFCACHGNNWIVLSVTVDIDSRLAS